MGGVSGRCRIDLPGLLPGGLLLALAVFPFTVSVGSWRWPDALMLALAGLASIVCSASCRRWQMMGTYLGFALAFCALLGGLSCFSAWQGVTPCPVNPLFNLALFSAGLFFIVLPRAFPWLGQGLAVLLGLLTWIALLLSLLGWNLPLFHVVESQRLSLPALTGLVLLLGAVVFSGFRTGQWAVLYQEREDRRLAMLGGLVLLISISSVGVVSVAYTARAVLSVHDDSVVSRVREDAELMRYTIGNAVRGLAQDRQQLGSIGADGDAAALLRQARRLGLGHLSGIVVEHPGAAATMAGDASDAAGSFRVPLAQYEGVALLWSCPLRIAVSYPLSMTGGEGRLTLITPLERWGPATFLERRFGRSGETLYCAGDGGKVRCLPSRFIARDFSPQLAFGGQLTPMARALAGDSGVIVAPDYRGVSVWAAFMPLWPEAGIVQKVDVDELMEPAMAGLRSGFLIVLLLALLGSYGLYRAVYPLARSVRYERHWYRSILDHAPVAMVVVGGRGKIEAFNAQAEELFAFSRKDVARRDPATLFDGPEIALWLRDPGREEKATMVCTAPGVNGNNRQVRVRARVLNRDAGVALLLVVEDISTRLVEEEMLVRWQSVFMHANWGLVLGDPQSNTLIDLNPAFAAMHGYGREELLGRPVIDVFAPTARVEMAEQLEMAHQNGRHCFNSIHLRKDGSEFPVRIDVSVIYHPDGRPRLRVVNVQDITREREIESSLRESEQMRRLVLDTQRDMVARFRIDSTVTFANRAFADAYGLTTAAIVGHRWLDLMQHNSEQLREMRGLFSELCRSPRRIEQVGKLSHPGAGDLWVQWTILPLYRENGILEGFQVSGHDITARKISEDALLESESWFRAMFESMFHSIGVLDLEGRILALNRNGQNFIGRPVSELIGMPIWSLDSVAELPDSKRLLLEGVGRARRGESFSFEGAAVSGEGVRTVFRCSMRPIASSQGGVGQIVVETHDVTDIHRQAESIRDRDERFFGIAASVPGLVFEFWRDGETLPLSYLNECNVVQTEGGERDFLDLLHPADRAGFLSVIKARESTGEALHWTGRCFRESGVWLNLGATSRKVEGRVVWSGVAVDFTEIRAQELEIERSRAALRELSAHYESVREDERRQMAREVHDELGQNLTALRMGLSVLGVVSGNPSVVSEAHRLKGLVDNSISVVRGIATTLRPAAMDLGISAALRWLAGEFETNVQIACVVDVDAEGLALDDALATALFRIAQESLTNVARHAAATHVSIRMHRLNRHLVLEIADDGKGFEVADDKRVGFGLLGMKERALNLGGELLINSYPGGGTVVSLQIPFE